MSEGTDAERFELTDEHVKLLRAARVRWNGAPSVDPKRPYGNGHVAADMHLLLTGEEWPPDSRADEETLEKSYAALHRETERALQVVLSAGTFEPGIYESPRYRDAWAPFPRENARG